MQYDTFFGIKKICQSASLESGVIGNFVKRIPALERERELVWMIKSFELGFQTIDIVAFLLAKLRAYTVNTTIPMYVKLHNMHRRSMTQGWESESGIAACVNHGRYRDVCQCWPWTQGVHVATTLR